MAVPLAAEVIVQWEDYFSGNVSTYTEPVFTASERAALTSFHRTWDALANNIPNPIPELAEAQLLPEWNELRTAARAGLQVFAERGKLPEDIEI